MGRKAILVIKAISELERQTGLQRPPHLLLRRALKTWLCC